MIEHFSRVNLVVASRREGLMSPEIETKASVEFRVLKIIT